MKTPVCWRCNPCHSNQAPSEVLRSTLQTFLPLRNPGRASKGGLFPPNPVDGSEIQRWHQLRLVVTFPLSTRLYSPQVSRWFSRQIFFHQQFFGLKTSQMNSGETLQKRKHIGTRDRPLIQGMNRLEDPCFLWLSAFVLGHVLKICKKNSSGSNKTKGIGWSKRKDENIHQVTKDWNIHPFHAMQTMQSWGPGFWVLGCRRKLVKGY